MRFIRGGMNRALNYPVPGGLSGNIELHPVSYKKSPGTNQGWSQNFFLERYYNYYIRFWRFCQDEKSLIRNKSKVRIKSCLSAFRAGSLNEWPVSFYPCC